jgi:MoaA/NifB/PqqE/SkfB family radical SAM enzyme
MHPLLWEMVALAREAGCSVGVTTSGTLIDEGVARRLPGEVDIVGISVLGADEVIVSNLRILDDRGVEELGEGTCEVLARHPLPDVCRGCYKALGI